MELLCPECRGVLSVADKRARCTTHGGDYEVLFVREQAKAPAPVAAVPALSLEPVGSAALADGAPALDGTVPNAPAPIVAAPPASYSLATQMRCVQHPALPAAQQCQSCGGWMCATCDFALPNGMHFCPSCATKPQTTLSPRRRKAMIWSFVFGGVSSAGLVGTMALAAVRPGTTTADQNALGYLMVIVVLVPSIVGFGMGLGAIDRRFHNPVSLWVATVWNGLILGLFLLLSVIGTMS